jgi:hypothetical protein
MRACSAGPPTPLNTYRCSADPGLRISNIGERITLRRCQDRKRPADGLHKAYLPE